MSDFKLKASTIALSAALLSPLAANAAVEGPSGMDFYEVPSINTTQNGDLIWYRETSVNLGAGASLAKAYNVMYRSTDSLGAQNAVTGTVLVSSKPWEGSGDRPTLSYAVGTHGLEQSCAPSMQMRAGTDYEARNIRAALEKGYAVLVTDYEGYTTGATPTYLAGESQAHAALDIFRAASQIPRAGISADAPAAVWGFSQGGQTAAWVGQIADEYAPDLDLVGVASGGTPADFPVVADYLNGSTGASFLLGGIIGLSEQYPDDIPVNDLASANGLAAIEDYKTKCTFEFLFDYMNDSLSSYTVGNKDLDELLQVPAIGQRINDQNLGEDGADVPVLLYHGTADEFIPIEQSVQLKRDYCGRFDKVTYDVYPSEHIVTLFQAAPGVLTWLDERFAGQNPRNSCYSLKQNPVSNANPGGGDFIVTLDEWNLDAELQLATLNQTVELPEDTTITADANITDESLVGDLYVPDFEAELNILVNLDVSLSVEPVGQIEATNRLSRDGILAINGSTQANVLINAAGFGWLKLPFNCKTTEPANFDLDWEGPIADFGAGGIVFEGETEFAELECGWMTSLFNALVAGPGQEYSFRLVPPAPDRL
ncbi:MAG: Triacylglycerol lipase [Oceanospirillaceae bacterium]|jgi:pimeloyl-ACP methyl ester carboxylesterase|uniref:lipase family protein n=1 Tax=unclassified Thalassolituus TaxID=2624967 RepID=UPI000B64D713|nr:MULTISPECIES: lipase family protein [unclassified Thalassolituus]MAE35108.1 Triacylglycerol lipase [Oceanospirillaceae bacterium]OUX64757.1 MAG: Triacylglycerol lipase [Oceanospirillaceae bacterium TMED276]MBN59531.1 Triacylglycerol lipase [Oceanospirillaceae bacterium]MDQ4424076.1 lipase family protein [Thalassolituus sp.]MDQ4427203.1 lipase family protein [Thalassolituus sp.]|tara:strand:- start:4913 stop:6703 length:1791 start_codon:yes stop_codon:yes gene_type:complete